MIEPGTRFPSFKHLHLYWMFMVVAAFEVSHHPSLLGMFSVPAVETRPLGAIALVWAVRAGGLLAMLAFVAGSSSAGRMLARFAGSGRRPVLPLGVEVLLGWSGLGLLLFGLAASGLFRLPLLIPLMAAAVLATWRDRRGVLARLAVARSEWWTTAPGAGRIYAAVAAFGMVAAFAAALAPALNNDSLIQHLPVSDRFLSSGGLVPLAGNFPFHLPAQSEMLRAFLSAVGGDTAGRLLYPVATGIATVLLLGSVSRRAGLVLGLLSAALFSTSAFALSHSFNSKPDTILLPAGIAAFSLALGGRTGARPLALAGVILGGAVSTKLSCAWLAAATLAGFLAQRLQSPSGGTVRGAAAMASAAALFFAPWAFKSWVFTGNPVHPFGTRYGNSPQMDALIGGAVMNYISNVTHSRSISSLGERVAALWTLTVGDGEGPLWLALIPAALVGAYRAGRGWLVALLVLLVSWSAGPVQFRYLSPVLPVLLALSIPLLAAPSRPATLAATATAFLALQAAHLPQALELPGRLPAILGLESDGDFFRRMRPAYSDAIGFMEKRLPESATVAYIGEDLAWPSPRRALVSSRVEAIPPYGVIGSSRNGEEAWKRLNRQMGVTHVLFNPVQAMFRRRIQALYPDVYRGLPVWEDLWRGHAREIYRSPFVSPRDGFFILYSLGDSPKGSPAFAYLPGTEGILATVEFGLTVKDAAMALRMLETMSETMGQYGQFNYFYGRVFKRHNPRNALVRLRQAERLGVWDPPLFEDMAELGLELEEPATERRARERLAGLVRPGF